MNKVTALVLTAVLVLSSGLTFAQDAGVKKDGMMDKGDKGGMMDGGMMGNKGMMMGMMQNGMMMKMGEMMNKTAVATSDGGIVIVAGDKITKYDKDLNVVKEVELKSNVEAMQKMMSQMMEKCPMMGSGMMGGMGQDTGKTTDAPAAAGTEVDHASHHQ